MRGFSADNLWRMRQFFEEYSNVKFLEQAVPELANPGRRFLEQAVPEIVSSIGAMNQPRQGKMREQHVQESVSIATDSNSAILAQAVRELNATVPWGHHVE
jgi:hypothetical protein